MSLDKKYSKDGERFLIPEDSHIARLYSVVDIGDQETGFRKLGKNGEDLGPQIASQVVLTFELQDVLIPDGRPAAISQTYTISLNDKSRLKSVIIALLGGGSEAKAKVEEQESSVGDLLKLTIGSAVLLSIVHRESKGKQYANIGGVLPVPSSMKQPDKKPVNPYVFWPDANVPIQKDMADLVPKWLIDRMNKRLNVISSANESPF